MRMTRKIRRAWLRGKPEWAKCYLLKARMRKQTKVITYQEKKTKLHSYSRYLVAGVLLACLGMGQSVASANEITISEITAASNVTNNVVKNGNTYNIYNQTVNAQGSALNRFENFKLSSNDIANLQLGQHTVGDVTYQAADRQINLVNNKVVIEGVLNAFKDGKIGGDVYFFSDQGIAVGATGVINVGRLTLGTSTAAGQSVFNDFDSYDKKIVDGNEVYTTALEKAQFITGSNNGEVSVNGVINSVGDVIIGAKKISVSGDAKINAGVNFEETTPVKTDTQTMDNYRAQFMNLNDVDSASLAVKANSGEIVLFGKSGINFSAEDTISITGNNSKKVQLVTNGGDIDIAASRDDEGGAVVSISNAKLDTQDNNGIVNITASSGNEFFDNPIRTPKVEVNIIDSTVNGGDINVSAIRSTMGDTVVNINGTTLDARDITSGGTANGNVNVTASTITETVSWALDGSDATINITGSTLTGDNVNVSAIASTTGEVGARDEEVQYSDEEIRSNIEKEIANDSDSAFGLIKDLLWDTGFEIRSIATGTEVHANAEVNIDESNIEAIGGSKVTDDITNDIIHGNINIEANAASEINTMGYGLLNLSGTVGISDVVSKVDINNSNLKAENDVAINALGNNAIDLYYLDLSIVDAFSPVAASAAFNWAELNSDVLVNIDGRTTIAAKDDVVIDATSIRNLSSSACAGGDTDYAGVTVNVSLADTKAVANVSGNIFADGDVSVSAHNTVDKDGDLYAADTSIAESLSGNTFLGKPLVNGFFKIPLNKFLEKKGIGPKFMGTPGQGEAWGANAATAILVSENVANANLNATLRGINDDFTADNSAGVNSVSVTAENVSRTKMSAMAYQNELTNSAHQLVNNKNYGIALAVNVGYQDNDATAAIGGDIKSNTDVNVVANTKIPWEFPLRTDWQNAEGFMDRSSALLNSLITVETSRNLGLGMLADSWAQSNNATEKVGGAGSVSVLIYDNDAVASVAENAKISTGSDADGNGLNVKALNEITTVNFAGNISFPIKMIPFAAIWEDRETVFKSNMWGTESDGAVLGGAAVGVHQFNDATAFIGNNVRVTSTGNVDVNAKNIANNIVVSGSGGKSESVALDGTTTVTLTDNNVYAYIGSANVTAKNINVNAMDDSIIVNLAGSVSTGEAVALGASVAYNHVSRESFAYINGNVTAEEAVIVNAKNTGEITAASLAGAVSRESLGVNAAGSSGTHPHKDTNTNGKPTVEEEEGTDNTKELAGELLSVGGKNIFDIDDGDTTIQKVSNNDQGAGVSKSQNGFAIAANVGVNRVLDNAQAYISKVDIYSDNPRIIADYVHINSLNDSNILAMSAAGNVDVSAGKASTGIAGSFMYNSITSTNNAFVNGVSIDVRGSSEKDEVLSITADNEEEILNISVSGGVGPRGVEVVGQTSINSINNVTGAALENSSVRAAEKVSVKARDVAKLQSYTGSAAITGSSLAGMGAAIGIQDIGAVTTAKVVETDVDGFAQDASSDGVTSYGDLEVIAYEGSNISSVVTTASVGNSSMAASASDSTSVVNTNTQAHIDSDENIKAAAIQVAAKNLANATVGVGQISVAKNAFGAATAQMISTNVVEAYIKGDTNKTNTIEADSITVNAENKYNGSAKDAEEDDTTAKTVAVGGTVGAGTASVAGSVTVNIIDNTTKAHIDEGVYETTGAINVNAQSIANMFGLAGGVSVGKAAGIGAAVDTQMLDAVTHAYIADNVTISEAGDITVNASSIEKITSVAAIASGGGNFAGVATANAHDIDVETLAYIGSDNSSKQTVLGESVNVGTVNINASDNAELKSNAGSAAVQVGGGGAAISGSAAVELLNKTVQASVGKANINAQALNLNADNIGNVLTTASGIALAVTEYGGAGSGSASESIVNYVTDAHLAGGSTVTVTDDIVLDVDSSFEHIGVATALAGSSFVGIGLSNDTTVLGMNTSAYAGDSATIIAGDDVSITADNLVDITSAVASGGAAIGAVNGGVGVNAIDSETKAYVGSGSNVTANNTNTSDGLNGFNLHAKDDTILEGGSGGGTVGGAGAGAAVNVNDISKNTLAYVGSGSSLNTKGATNIEAINNEKIFNVTVQGSGGLFAGLAGAVAVHDLDIITKAYTDSNVKINQGTDFAGAGNVTINADHNLGISSYVAGGSLGAGAIGAAVDVANVITQTNAYLGDGGKVTTAGDLQVTADETIGDFEFTINNNETDSEIETKSKTETVNTNSTVVATAIGLGGISGSVSVYNFGSGMSEADKGLLNVADANGKTQSFDAWLGEQINQSNTSKAMAAYGDNAVAKSVGTAVGKRNFTTTAVANNSTIGEAGTAAKLGKNVVVNATNVNVDAKSDVEMDVDAGNGSAGAVAAGASVGVVHNNSKVSSIIDGGAKVTANGAFVAQAEGETILGGKAVSPAVGIVAGSAASLDLNSAVDVTTKIDSNAVVDAGSIAIKALNTPKLNAYATGVGVGVAGVGAVVALVSSTDDANVVIGDGVRLKAASTSDNEGVLEILAATQKADDYNAYVEAEAGSGGVLNGSVTVTQIDLDNTTKVSIGQKANFNGKKVDIQAKHEDAFNYENISAGAGGFSGTGSDNRVNVKSDVAVSIGAGSGTKGSITSSETTNIKAENITTKGWLAATADDRVGENDYNALSAGASLANGTGIVNKTGITHNTDVTLGNVVVQANAIPLTDEEIAAGTKLADKNALTIDARSQITSKDYQYIGTGAVVEAAHIDDSNKVKANTSVNIGSAAELYAGLVDVADTSNKIKNTELRNGTYDAADVGGGKIAIGAKNDADIYSKTIVNTWGAAGYAGTSNNVSYDNTITANINGTLETANGDIALSVGRDSADALGVVKVNADSKLLNSTIIPISIEPDPTATLNSTANLNVGSTAKVLSDRDIYLKANAGDTTALGYGEIKDWAHAMADDIGAKNSITGSEVVNTSADVKVDGYVETGIHRNQSIEINGSPVDVIVNVSADKDKQTHTKKWETDVVHTAGIGFEYQDNDAIVSAYKNRLEDLRELCSLYSADDGAVAAYEAEIQIIMDKMVENGFARYETYKDNNGNSATTFVMYDNNSLKTNKVTIKGTQVRLGNIVVEADNLYGNGTLNAGADAEVKIINNSSNNLVVNNISISSDSKGTVNSLYDGGYIIYNNANVSDAGDIAARNDGVVPKFTAINSKSNSSEQPTLQISNTFNPSRYITTDNGSVVKWFAAPSLTVADGAKVYNPKGNVIITSEYGDVNNGGTINAGSVSIQAKNGDYTQYAEDHIVDIGGSPVGFDEKEDEKRIDNGILANGNVYISARYININSNIQSGVGHLGWAIIIPEVPTFYKDGDENTAYTISDIDAMTDKASATFTLANGTAGTADSACGQVTYDVQSNRIVIDGIETNGGSVELVGTILNTTHGSSDKGKISVLDGSSKVDIVNNSNIALELKNISTGDNVEGVIKITDLDFNTGEKTRTTTYTRKDGVITTAVQTYTNGVAGNEVTSTVNGSKTTYDPEELYYVWQKAKDSTTVTEYHYSDSKPVIWWKDGDFNDNLADLDIDASEPIETENVLLVPNGTYITNTHVPNPGDGIDVGNATGKDGYYQYVYKIQKENVKYDERTETNRLWYTAGIVKKYDHWYKIKESTTEVTHTAIDASHPVAIDFIGDETGGDFDVTSNGSDVYVSGNIKNTGGFADISAQNIYQESNGFIDTGNLELIASGNIGTAGAALLTNAAEFGNIKANGGSVYIYDTNDKVNLSVGVGDNADILAADVVSITAAGDICSVQSSPWGISTNIKANRIELTSENGSIKDLTVRVGNAEKTPAYGLKVSAAGDIDIANYSGDLYLDSVVSKNGDVRLVTNGNFIDNNFTDVVEDDVQKVIESYTNAQVLEKQTTTSSLQKNALINAAQAKYNRYQALKRSVVNGKFTLSEVDKAALQKLGYSAEQVAAYIAERQAEFDELKAFGAEAWSEESIATYGNNLKESVDKVFANANLQAQDVKADTFLTADERAVVLVGSARSSGALVTGISGSVFKETTDTTLTRKAVPNVKGNDVTLVVRNVAGDIGNSYTVSTTVDAIKAISQKDFAGNGALTEEDKQVLKALQSAEYGDITVGENGDVTINVVDALVVDADDLKVRGLSIEIQGETYGKGSVNNIYVNSEEAISFNTLNADGEVRLKSDDSINGNVINSNGNVVLEASNGTIGKAGTNGQEALVLGENTQTLTARAGEDIYIAKNGDLNVNTVYSKDGDVSIAVNGNDIIAQTIVNSLLDAGDGSHITGRNIRLLGAENLGSTSEYLTVGVNGGHLQATVNNDIFLRLQDNLANAKVSGENIYLINEGTIAGGRFHAFSGMYLWNHKEILHGLFRSDIISLINEGLVSRRALFLNYEAYGNVRDVISGSFYRDNIIGKDGDEKVEEEVDVTSNDANIIFSEVASHEDYEVH